MGRAFKQWVFCYGSNNFDQLAERVGHRDFEYKKAHATNWQRVFRGWSEKWQGGVASIKAQRGKAVYGAAAFLTSKDIERLDEHEGVSEGYYSKKTITIFVDGEPTQAIAYIAKSRQHNPPSRAYLRAIAKTVSAFWRNKDGSAVTEKSFKIA